MSDLWRPGEMRVLGLPNRAGIPLLTGLVVIAIAAVAIAGLVLSVNAVLVIGVVAGVAVSLAAAGIVYPPAWYFVTGRIGPYYPGQRGDEDPDERYRRRD